MHVMERKTEWPECGAPGTHIWLVGVENGAITLENFLAVP